MVCQTHTLPTLSTRSRYPTLESFRTACTHISLSEDGIGPSEASGNDESGTSAHDIPGGPHRNVTEDRPTIPENGTNHTEGMGGSPNGCRCRLKNRNLVLCFDGTAKQLSHKHTNVIRLFSILEANEDEQRVYYDSGLGTYVNEYSQPTGFFSGIGEMVSRTMDKMFAW